MHRYGLDRWDIAALGGVAALVLAAVPVPLREDLTGSTLALLLVLPVLLGAMSGAVAAVAIADQVGAVLTKDGWKWKERA